MPARPLREQIEDLRHGPCMDPRMARILDAMLDRIEALETRPVGGASRSALSEAITHGNL